MRIPKVLHQIWIGPRPAPMSWIDTWRSVNPDFEHRLWTEERLGDFGFRNGRLYRAFMDAGLYDGAADVARVEILHRCGGVYADADSVALRPLGKAAFVRAAFFAPREPVDDRGLPPVTDLISNAFMGSVQGHPILGDYLDRLTRARARRPMWRTTGPGALTASLAACDAPNVLRLPAWTFFTTSIDGEALSGGNPYAQHFWSTTSERWGYAGTTPYPGRQSPGQ
jgi:mannosyltransferase OCH1-like enzyme